MPLIDYHIHSNFSKDAKSTIDEMVKKAKELGLKEICFTQHYDPNRKDIFRISLSPANIGEYIKQAKEASKKYGIPVKIGLEIEYNEKYEKETREIIDRFDLDFTLGSVHSIKSWVVEYINSRFPIFNLGSREEMMDVYFSKLSKAIKSGLFDVMAHMDIFRRNAQKNYKNMKFADYENKAREIVRLLKRNNVGFEVNTSGFNKLGKQYPVREFIELAHREGIKKVTIGSDAHSDENLGKNLDRAVALLKEIGYKKVATFNKHKVSYIKMGELLR